MSVVYVKSGVLFTTVAPGGFRILSAIDQTAAKCGTTLVITSACDGEHSGPSDPHHRGEAYDVRSHDIDPVLKDKVIATIMDILGTDRFSGFIESPGTDNEHFHIQVKKGTIYP